MRYFLVPFLDMYPLPYPTPYPTPPLTPIWRYQVRYFLVPSLDAYNTVSRYYGIVVCYC